jgi:PAS domain S-box-containing protein
MNKKPNEPDSLRIEAEEQLIRAPLTDNPARSAEDILHELHVYQVELEMQNETLRQSQVTLEESRDRYVDFYDFAPVGYLTLSRDGLISEINLTGATLLGKERNKLMNRRFARFVAPEDIDLWQRHFMTVLQHDSKQICELEIRRDNGSRLHVQLDSLHLEKNDKAPVLRIALTDITERKQAEDALHKSETYLRMLEQREIVQTSLDGFWVVDTKNARILEANDAFCNMVGYSREELLTMSIPDLEVEESPAETAAHIKKIMEIGNDRFETRHRHKQGHLVDLEISVTHSELDDDINFVFTRDITERKQAEKKLRESELRFRTIFESATDCMLILDKDGRITDINSTGYEGLGYEEREMLGRQIAEFDTPEYAALVPERMALVTKEGIATFESAHVRKDGTVMPIEVSSKIIHLDGEQRYFSMIRDITERKLMEQQLRLKEFVLDQARDAIYLIDRNLRFVYVNEEACRALGYSRHELLGLTPSDIDPGTTPEEAKRIWKQILNRGHITFKTRHRRRDGSLFPVEIQGSFFEYHGQIMNMALARNITEREHATQKVAELQYQNELILNTAGDGICGINRKGRINFINPAAAKMLGYSVNELHGLSLNEFYLLSKHDGSPCPVANCPILTSINGTTTCHRGEEVYRRKDGSTFPASCTRAPIIDKGKCIGAVVMFRDITERKRAEQQVRDLSMHLQTVREEEKSSFAREIHDDLGSTLSALKIELFQLNQGLSAEQKKMPLFARVESMVDLLNDAVISTRRIITDLRPTMLDDLGLLAALEWQAEQFHKHSGIECWIACVDDEGREGKLDKNLSINLFRIFQEALTNVARHSGASRVEVEFRLNDNEIILSISDNGCGLPEGHTIAQTSFGIRGMHERIRQLGGQIKFDNQPGNGLNVTVILPQPGVPH